MTDLKESLTANLVAHTQKLDELEEPQVRAYYEIALKAISEQEDRKQKTNTFFITLNSVVVTCFGFMSSAFNSSSTYRVGIASLAFLGLLSILEWKKLIDALNTNLKIKDKIILSIEKLLPISLFKEEADIKKSLSKKQYKNFFIESKIPLTFILLYAFYLYLALVGKNL